MSLFSPGKEVLVSRVLAVTASSSLMTAVTAQLLDPGISGAHPRHWIVAVTCTLLGLRIVAHVPWNAVGWLILVMGLFSALTVGTLAMSGWFVPAWLSTWLWWPTYGLLPVVALLFPTGRLVSARWRPVLVIAVLGLVFPMIGIGWASWSSPATFWDDAVAGTAKGGFPVVVTVVGVCCLFAGLLGSLLSLFVRWLLAARGERRLLVWSVVCTTSLTLALFFEVDSLFFEVISTGTFWGAWVVVAAAFPVATLIAIVWYGLYDIDLVVHRSILFGLITIILTSAYTVTVMVFTSPPTPGHVIGTVAVVLLLSPLYRRLSARLDRWLFGDRADPYRALSRLGEQLENLIQPDEVLKVIARSVGSALRLPYVEVRVDSLLATSGVSRRWPRLEFPLRYDGDNIGALVVEARAPEESFGRRERRLLVDFARQAALAARSVRLAKELQRIDDERLEDVEDLVCLTSEVNDNVAPGVAAVRLQIDALRQAARCEEDTYLDTRLAEIVEDLSTMLGKTRQVVRSIRPYGVHFGLVETVRRRASKFESQSLNVTVTSVGMVDRLSAGVENEAYRIVSAALSNVAEHANASACEVRLVRNADRLEIKVTDDGAGIPPDVVPGVGLELMRRRCETRGGSFKIERLHRGTRIVAVLPVGEHIATAVQHRYSDVR